jgi:hypothetical protein
MNVMTRRLYARAHGTLALCRRIAPLVLGLFLLLLSARGASAQKFDPYGEAVPEHGATGVLPDADNLADPAGTPVPPSDKPSYLPTSVSLVGTSGGHFSVDGHPFRHVGVNEVDYVYEGDPNGDQWNDTYFLRQGGVKQIRVILANDALPTQTILDDLDTALGIAWSRGIRVTVALTNFYYGDHWGHSANGGHTAVAGDAGYYTDSCCGGIHLLNHAWIAGGYNVNYKPFVRAVVSRFAGDGRIFAWEVGNEIGAPNGDVEAAIAFYRDMALTIKGIDPGHMVAPGIICTQWLPLTTQDQKNRLYQYMDYVVEHHYDPNSPNPGDLSDNQLAATLNKPLVIEEYGVNQTIPPYTDHSNIMPKVSDFFDWAYATQPYKQADAVMVWGVDFGWDHGSGDAYFGPWEQGLSNDYLQLWRETADWSRVSPRYSDVPPGDTFYTYIECLSNRRAINGLFGWVSDSANDQYQPGASITRADAVKALVRAMGFPLQFPATPTFTDVPRTSPYYRYIETAVAYGIISGYADHTFRPDNNLTRGQMCKVIVVAGQVRYGWPINTAGSPHFTDVLPGSTFFIYVETAYNRQIVNGYGNVFYPNNPTTRGQFAKMLSQAISCS